MPVITVLQSRLAFRSLRSTAGLTITLVNVRGKANCRGTHSAVGIRGGGYATNRRRLGHTSRDLAIKCSSGLSNDRPEHSSVQVSHDLGGADLQSELRESPFTLPNALTLARLAACPFLGYFIIQGDFVWATSILVVGGFSDWLDGYIARKWHQRSVLGSILDPAADKALMTTLVVTLAWSGLLPLPLAILIFGRDVALSLSAFYFRYSSLPPPRTMQRYWNPSIPSAEVKPTQISKVNTALQLVLMGVTTASPLLPFSIASGLTALQYTVAGTTIWSGLSYIGRGGFTVLKQPSGRAEPPS